MITKNFVQKIDSLYRGELFSNKLISFDKVFDMVMNGEISDVKTQMAVMKAALIRKGSEEDIK